jgi:peptide deformylase
VFGSVALALHALAQELAIAPHCFRLFASTALRGLFVAAPQFHLSEDALTLHFLFQGSQSLVNIVVADEYLHGGVSPFGGRRRTGNRAASPAYLASAGGAVKVPAGGSGEPAAPGRALPGAKGRHISIMALLKIARMGNPVLRQRAAPIKDPGAPWVRRLAEDMIETMQDAGGTGLAAPQVHQPWRMVVFFVSGERLSGLPGDKPQELTVLVNPVVELLGTERAFGWEGCLSVPGLRGIVPRHLRIRYTATGLDGEPIAYEVEGFHARVVQHDCDHLDGVLYPQRLADARHLFFVEELQRHSIDLAAFLSETQPS